MAKLSLDDVEGLAERYMSQSASVNDMAALYSRDELCEFFRENCERMAVMVEKMSPAQLAYRMPGSPTGFDASGDEEHFDISEIVTHMAQGNAFHRWGITRAMKHDRPEFPKAPEGAKITGSTGNIMGKGGWSGASGQELAAMLRESASSFLEYVQSLPEEIDASVMASFGPYKDVVPQGWIGLAAVHSGMHARQIEQMQPQPDYPRE